LGAVSKKLASASESRTQRGVIWISLITTIAHFQPIGLVETVDSFCLFGRCSRPNNARMVERSMINWNL